MKYILQQFSMKIFSSSLVVLFLAPSFFGQKHGVEFLGGAQWSSIRSKNFVSTEARRVGSNFGINYLVELDERIRFIGGVSFVQKGFQGLISQAGENGEPEGIRSDFDFDYLSFPLKFGGRFGNQIAVVSGVGLAPSFLVQAETMVDPYYNNSAGDVYDMRESANNFDLYAIAELGVEYVFFDMLTSFLVLNYQRSLTSITTDNYFKNSQIWHRGFGVSLGIRLILVS